jgi:sulfate permease, SulP family
MSVSDDPRSRASPWNVARGDFFGGVAAGVVALPLALAFGVASGLGAAAGLYGAIATGIVAAVFILRTVRLRSGCILRQV